MLSSRRVGRWALASVAIGIFVLSCCSTSATSKGSSTSTTNPSVSATLFVLSKEVLAGTSGPGRLASRQILATAASVFAAASHQVTEVIAENGTCNTITGDIVSNRVDLWIVDGRVVKAVVERPSAMTSTT